MSARGRFSACGAQPALLIAGIHVPESVFLECVKSVEVNSSEMPRFSLTLSLYSLL